MKILIYQNNRNNHKYLEIHKDNSYHFAVRQFLLSYNPKLKKFVCNYVGDTFLHRMKKGDLLDILDDYHKYGYQEKIMKHLKCNKVSR